MKLSEVTPTEFKLGFEKQNEHCFSLFMIRKMTTEAVHLTLSPYSYSSTTGLWTAVAIFFSTELGSERIF